MSDWNAKIIEEFRGNDGKVGGGFEGAPMVLVHHKGRKTGRDNLIPLVYLPDDSDPDTIYVFASKGGHPAHPDWYRNLIAAGQAEVERGTERYAVRVRELEGDARDRIFAEQVARMPGFGEYEEKTRGIRKIPVIALTRA